ncbi:MAG: 3-deoxy-D-manno-octulosonic acid transferase [Chitinophagaceae bacterium]|nr:3-deoxy-D-manno-octulosonic acid transferase [Chitinophagaceae bacterium]MCW5927705.1 3-deoxy-D-manno-octulosonic acid transferase [Chitinophagaceae bacterium]
MFVIFFEWGASLVSLWNPKARLWIRGRRNIFEKLRAEKSILPKRANTVWIHCASLGEFEQGRPVIETLKKTHPDTRIVLSFFSPSGYEIRKNYPGADMVCYLPSDRASNVRKFIDIIEPTLVLWVRYEFWNNYLQDLKRREIPVLLISALFRTQQLFFKPWGGFWRKTLQGFTHIFVQNEYSAELLEEIGINNVTIAGDTRFDRVSAIAESFEPLPEIAAFCAGHQVLVAGSTWTEDEEELTHYVRVHTQTRFIIAPHEVDEDNIKDVLKEFPGAVLYSDFITDMQRYNETAHTIIINNIGMLSRLYHYADIAYVGGGFGDDGLHNILEAAVYGKPVLFGPVHQKHYEALEMIETGGALCVKNALELENVLDRLWQHPEELQQRGEAAQRYVAFNRGATQKILDYIQRNRLCTS